MNDQAVSRCLSYDPETGLLRWKAASSNACAVGRIAGTRERDGYVYIRLMRRRLLAHRVAWFLHYGSWPIGPLDHKNMVKSDNRIENLRLASVTENNRNRPAQSNNTVGFKGVTLSKQTGRYEARIMVNKRRVALGTFDNAREAGTAYERAAKELHREFARHE